ncbi:hypothetical protein ACWC0A_05765 [Streptomyces scopuliridis]
MLMELEDVNCWSLSEAIGQRGPHRLHHLLSRAVWDEQAVLKRTAAWAVDLLDDGDGILIADETETRSPPPTRWPQPASTPARSAVWTCARSPCASPSPRPPGTRPGPGRDRARHRPRRGRRHGAGLPP